jgi:hypothetical protein
MARESQMIKPGGKHNAQEDMVVLKSSDPIAAHIRMWFERKFRRIGERSV